MKVFVSWARDDAKRIAELLRAWLPLVIQSLEPWMSSEDIDKGARWSLELGRELDATGYGVICVTPASQSAPWLLFEAGALSKRFETSRVSPFVLGLPVSELEGPLAQFQAVTPVREDVLRLLKSLNLASGEQGIPEPLLLRTFDREWPDLDQQLSAIGNSLASMTPTKPRRSQNEMLEEVLNRVRGVERQLANDHRVRSARPLRDRSSAAESEFEKMLVSVTRLAERHFAKHLVGVRSNNDAVTVVLNESFSDVKMKRFIEAIASDDVTAYPIRLEVRREPNSVSTTADSA